MSERSRRVKGKRDHCQPDARFAATRNPILELLVLGYDGWLVRDQMTFEVTQSNFGCYKSDWIPASCQQESGDWVWQLLPMRWAGGWTLCQSHQDSWRQKWFLWSMRQASVMLLSESEHLQPDVFRIYPDLSGHQTHMLAVLDDRAPMPGLQARSSTTILYLCE